MKRKCIVWLLTCFMSALALSGCGKENQTGEETINGIIYSLYNYNGEKYYYVSGVESKDIEDAFIVDKINGCPVEKIGHENFGAPFKECKELKKVIMPNTIKVIGQSAFEWCESLETILIPPSVEKISSFAFMGCKSLVEISIPDAVMEVEYATFERCGSLINLKLSKNTRKIGTSAFRDCSALGEIILPEGLQEIQGKAFCGCTNLKEIILPTSIKTIYGMVFWDCNQLSVYYAGDLSGWQNVSVSEYYNYSWSDRVQFLK